MVVGAGWLAHGCSPRVGEVGGGGGVAERGQRGGGAAGDVGGVGFAVPGAQVDEPGRASGGEQDGVGLGQGAQVGDGEDGAPVGGVLA